MPEIEEQDEQLYEVVVNHEEQYSIWPADQDLPAGWRKAGKAGRKDECLSHIDEVWTDMRPLSLRRYMEAHADDPPADLEPVDDGFPSLVDRLATGTHPVEASIPSDGGSAALKDAIEQRYMFIKFTGTRGGTELGVSVDDELSDLSGADFESGTGEARIVGTLNLDFEPVRCVARIQLATLAGVGHLERTADG